MPRAEHLFVVRIWREATAAEVEWRGSVKDAESNLRFYFSKFTLVDFIALRSGASSRLGLPRVRARSLILRLVRDVDHLYEAPAATRASA